jgi:hypothetical protein
VVNKTVKEENMNKIARIIALGTLSLALVVLVGCGDETTDGEPQNFALAAGTDGLEVVLTWEEPVDGEPDNYIIYFREVGTTDWVEGATVAGDVLTYTHDPSEATGDYYVAADFGGDEYDSDIMTTIPVSMASMIIYELEAPGNAGYGWAISSDFTGSTYSMANDANAALVDFYITNFVDDPAGGPWGAPWSIASPDLAPNDPGGSFVPTANWRQNWFSDPITDPQAALPNYGPTTFFNYTEGIETDPTYIGVYLGTEEHYGLVMFSGVNPIAGSINVEAWFQTVQGLRLIAH